MQIKVKSFPYALCYFSSLITIKVFEDVVEILDPEMNIDSEIGEEEMQVERIELLSYSYVMRMMIIYNIMQLHVMHRLSPVLPSHAFQVKAVSALQEAA